MDLLKHCGPDDVITPTGDYPGQNCDGWARHMSAFDIRRLAGDDVWDRYTSFAMERNPWDKVASNYWYKRGYRHTEARKAEQVSSLERIARGSTGYPWSLNTWLRYRLAKERLTLFKRPRLPRGSYWLTDRAGNLIVDSVLRYEHRALHLEYLSDLLGLKLSVASQEGRKTRKTKRRYTAEYDDWSREAIRNYFRLDLSLSRYGFGEQAPDDVIERSATPATNAA